MLITQNAAEQLPACLQSLHFADEIIVVDSGSNDHTLAVAHKAGAKVIHQEWLGFGRQKQFAITQASYDWVLCIDSDERVSDELKSSIQQTLNNPKHTAYRMPRSNRFMGRFLKHGEGYPDWSLRLFNRRHAKWSDDAVHEKVIHEDSVGTLTGDLLHESGEDIARYFDKQNRYTTLQAQQLFKRGKQCSLAQLVLSPLFRFIRFYLFKRGFMDGVPGLVHILIGCFNSFSKYAKLIELHRLHKQP
ncbi:glycosyltransferase involved in cell wall biosynthesis [Chitinivorax tropicus]|uniref:Glycosyltransferase involved in cell wall biosynthesis n=1 Tax=Chitinivorax tropicus TaxID=714531 RepID=A0A840MQL2_9PROT|nr:glycosyltransferase involved in cell wall biosynthesis [Chitinivorax tropicus]